MGQVYSLTPDFHEFLGLTWEAWEPIRTLQQCPWEVMGIRGAQVAGEMLSACTCVRLVTAKGSVMEYKRGLTQAPMTCQTWAVTRDVGATRFNPFGNKL